MNTKRIKGDPYSRFELDPGSDFESIIAKRTLTGRLTPRREQIIEQYVERANESHRYPYGKSADGYAYRCGHDYDCCGCSSGKSFDFDIESHWKGSKVTITMWESFNY